MASQLRLSRIALCATFFALGVIALGAFTRLIDAGLGCPDWPGCYGHLTVPSAMADASSAHLVAYKAWAEMIHRYFVGGLSALILGMVGYIACRPVLRSRSNLVLAGLLVMLLVYQILLGQWTVTLQLLPVIVTQHLLGGFLILTVLWLLHLNNKPVQPARETKRYHGLIVAALLGTSLLLLQIMLGAWTSTNYASLSCADFPFCMNDHDMVWHVKEAFNLFSPVGVNYEGGVLPILIRQTIQMAHRWGALIVALYLFFLAAFTLRLLPGVPTIMKSVLLMLGLLCIQLCLGISNIVFKLPLVTALSHTLMAALLWLSVITLTFHLITLKRKATQQ